MTLMNVTGAGRAKGNDTRGPSDAAEISRASAWTFGYYLFMRERARPRNLFDDVDDKTFPI